MKVGIIGAGQLGRMIGLAGIPLGIRCEFVDANTEAPAGSVGQVHAAALDDPVAIAALAKLADVVTPEIENVSIDALRAAQAYAPVHPAPAAIAAAQDRLSEKQLFAELDIPTAAFVAIDDVGDLDTAADALGWPIVLKARRLGYDGRGQRIVDSIAKLRAAWTSLGKVPALAEGWIEFQREVSLIAVRGTHGDTAFYPLAENSHEQGILATTIAPFTDSALQARAQAWLSAIMDRFDYRGVLTVEFFHTADGLVANEIAPRVHNSGHWTIEGAVTSQFENHLRAICSMPLGDPTSRGHSAMVNLIGEAPDRDTLLAIPGLHFHDYGKTPRPGRKLGHYTIVDENRDRLLTRLAEAGTLTRKKSVI